MSLPRLLLLLALLILAPGIFVRGTEPSTAAKPGFRVIQGQLLKADSRQPLGDTRIALGDTADAHSIFGFVEHHLFAKGRTDGHGHFALTVPLSPEFGKADEQKTLVIVVSGNRDYLGVLLSQGEKPVYLVPKVATPQ